MNLAIDHTRKARHTTDFDDRVALRDSAANQPLLPQVVVMASGDLLPFDVLLQRDGTEERRIVTGRVDGSIEILDDGPDRRR
jgi:hypothetical protein